MRGLAVAYEASAWCSSEPRSVLVVLRMTHSVERGHHVKLASCNTCNLCWSVCILIHDFEDSNVESSTHSTCTAEVFMCRPRSVQSFRRALCCFCSIGNPLQQVHKKRCEVSLSILSQSSGSQSKWHLRISRHLDVYRDSHILWSLHNRWFCCCKQIQARSGNCG